jgi:hypothetical protein
MRYIVLASVLIALAPVALAQTNAGKPPNPDPEATPPGYTVQPPNPDPDNCGTPDEPKPCAGTARKASAKKAPKS